MKFERPNSNIVPFGTNANENKRFAFGTNNYTNDINENLNDSFKLGWETVGINSKPPRQWFNGLAYTSTYLTSYLFQAGIPEWNDKQKYYINSIVMGSDGNLYKSLTGTEETPNTNNNPTLAGSTSWKSILSDYALINGDETKKFKVADAVADNEAINKKQLNESLANIQPLPIGAILNGYTIFDNCIVAFGGEFNRADYPKLWAYLQANPTLVKTQAEWQTEATANGGICGFFSDGNGTTTFRVPNLDKAFLRPDSRGVASYQGDMLKSHSHKASYYNVFNSAYNNGFANKTAYSPTYTSTPSVEVAMDPSGGGVETRPKNIAVLPLIVAKQGD